MDQISSSTWSLEFNARIKRERDQRQEYTVLTSIFPLLPHIEIAKNNYHKQWRSHKFFSLGAQLK